MSNLPSIKQPSGLAVSTDAYDEVSLDDIVLPKLYLQQPLSDLVGQGVTKPGDLVVANSADDAGAEIVADANGKSVTAYILTRKKAAATSDGQSMEFQSHKDPNDPNSWDVFFYDIAIPEFDDTLPICWMLWRTAGRKAYEQINTLMARQQARGDSDPLAINVTVKQTQNRTGNKYYYCALTAASPDPDGLEIALAMRQRAIALNQARGYENDAAPPVTVEQPALS